MPKRQKPATSRCPLVADDALRRQADARTAAIREAFPAGLSQPALRALESAGYVQLGQLAGVSEQQLRALHGLGPKGIRILKAALQRRKLDLSR